MAFINSYVDAGTAQVPAEKWDLLLDWGLAASQTGPEGASLQNLGAPEPALCQDKEFLEWCSQKLATTFGRESEVPPKARAGPHDDIHLVQRITKNMGRSFVAGVQALAPTIVGATRQGSALDRDSERRGWAEECILKTTSLPSRGTVGWWTRRRSCKFGPRFNRQRRLHPIGITSGCQ